MCPVATTQLYYRWYIYIISTFFLILRLPLEAVTFQYFCDLSWIVFSMKASHKYNLMNLIHKLYFCQIVDCLQLFPPFMQSDFVAALQLPLPTSRNRTLRVIKIILLKSKSTSVFVDVPMHSTSILACGSAKTSHLHAQDTGRYSAGLWYVPVFITSLCPTACLCNK